MTTSAFIVQMCLVVAFPALTFALLLPLARKEQREARRRGDDQ